MSTLKDFDQRVTFNGTVLESVRLTPEDYKDEVRHIVLELDRIGMKLEVGQSIGVSVPGPHEFGNDEHFRLYSIAGFEPGHNGSSAAIALCVRRCFYIDEVNGERYPGVASHFLCDRAVGEVVPLSGPYPSVFKLPEDVHSNIMMVGLGTGIAPFRAFVRHIYAKKHGWKGQVRLFYGAKTGLELLYMNDLKNDLGNYYDETTFQAFEAVSPRPYLDEPISLDHTLEQNADEVWKLVQSPDTYVYLAGLEPVREMMDKAMSTIAGSEEKWRRRKKEMVAGERWSELIY
ncbi:MAG: hypothetical protein AMXMBFR84_47840 [Candidatus Hydrogenedentota bacterium]